MKKIIQLTTAIFVTILLLGCDIYNKEEFKQRIKDGFDTVHANTKFKGDFCYYIGGREISLY